MKTVTKIAVVSLTVFGLSACDEMETNAAANAETGAEVAAEQSVAAEPEVICADCGVIVAITPVKVEGEASGAGVAIGAVVGGLLGNQVGGGDGKKVATVIGAVGGAVAGNEIEKRQKATTYYDVDVDLDDGSRRVVSVRSAEMIAVGTKVKVVGNNIELL